MSKALKAININKVGSWKLEVRSRTLWTRTGKSGKTRPLRWSGTMRGGYGRRGHGERAIILPWKYQERKKPTGSRHNEKNKNREILQVKNIQKIFRGVHKLNKLNKFILGQKYPKIIQDDYNKSLAGNSGLPYIFHFIDWQYPVFYKQTLRLAGEAT